jgi:hypothetical protein
MRKPSLSPTASKGGADWIHGITRFGLNTGPTSAVNIRLTLARDEVVRLESPVQHRENASEAYARPMRSLCEQHPVNTLPTPGQHAVNTLDTGWTRHGFPERPSPSQRDYFDRTRQREQTVWPARADSCCILKVGGSGGGVPGVRPSSGAARTECADPPAFTNVPSHPDIAAPGDGCTPPTPSSATTIPFRLDQIFRCRVIVFRLTARIPRVLACRHENFIRFAKTVHRKFSGCVVSHGRRIGVGPIQREYPADWGL